MGFEVVAAGGEISGDGQYPYEDTFDSERGEGEREIYWVGQAEGWSRDWRLTWPRFVRISNTPCGGKVVEEEEEDDGEVDRTKF